MQGEGTSLQGNRLINIILLMAIAYIAAIFQGTEIRKKQVQKYVSRHKEPEKKHRRRSTFGVGLDGEKWVEYLERYSLEVEQLMKLSPNKRRFYQQGMRAATLIRCISSGLFVTPPGIAYEMKEKFREIYETNLTVEKASNKIKEWLNYAQVVVRESASTIENHFEGICNYFLHRTTSGVMEGINNRIKLIMRCGYGFTNFNNFRNRVDLAFLIR